MDSPRPAAASHRGPRVPAAAYAGLAVGLALFTALIAYQGLREVAAALAVAGPGLLVVALFHVAPMLADAIGWRCLLDRTVRPSVGAMLRARWIGESVNGMLPVMQVGGNVVKARLLAAWGVPAELAGASVVVGVMVLVGSQVPFTLLGVGLLLSNVAGRALVPAALVGTGIMVTMLAGFYLAQQRGLFGGLARAAARMVSGGPDSPFVVGAAALDAAIHRLYRDLGKVGRGAAWHFAGWLVGTGEVWLALRFLGHPVGIEQALLLESLGQAVRAAAFVVPGALGVQEGGYLVLGSVIGLSAETSLALSLAKRVREVVLGVPGLIAWQAEGALRGGARRTR